MSTKNKSDSTGDYNLDDALNFSNKQKIIVAIIFIAIGSTLAVAGLLYNDYHNNATVIFNDTGLSAFAKLRDEGFRMEYVCTTPYDFKSCSEAGEIRSIASNPNVFIKNFLSPEEMACVLVTNQNNFELCFFAVHVYAGVPMPTDPLPSSIAIFTSSEKYDVKLTLMKGICETTYQGQWLDFAKTSFCNLDNFVFLEIANPSFDKAEYDNPVLKGSI